MWLLTPSVGIAQWRGVSGVNMPEVIIIHGENLALNGVALRKERAFFDVYSH